MINGIYCTAFVNCWAVGTFDHDRNVLDSVRCSSASNCRAVGEDGTLTTEITL